MVVHTYQLTSSFVYSRQKKQFWKLSIFISNKGKNFKNMCKGQWNSIPRRENSKWMLAFCLKSQLDSVLRSLHRQSSALLTLIWAFPLVWLTHSNTSIVQRMLVPYSLSCYSCVQVSHRLHFLFLITLSFQSLGSFLYFFFFLKCLHLTKKKKKIYSPTWEPHQPLSMWFPYRDYCYLSKDFQILKINLNGHSVLILPIFVEQLCARFCCRYWVYSHEQNKAPFLWNWHFSRGGKQIHDEIEDKNVLRNNWGKGEWKWHFRQSG